MVLIITVIIMDYLEEVFLVLVHWVVLPGGDSILLFPHIIGLTVMAIII